MKTVSVLYRTKRYGKWQEGEIRIPGLATKPTAKFLLQKSQEQISPVIIECKKNTDG